MIISLASLLPIISGMLYNPDACLFYIQVSIAGILIMWIWYLALLYLGSDMLDDSKSRWAFRDAWILADIALSFWITRNSGGSGSGVEKFFSAFAILLVSLLTIQRWGAAGLQTTIIVTIIEVILGAMFWNFPLIYDGFIFTLSTIQIFVIYLDFGYKGRVYLWYAYMMPPAIYVLKNTFSSVVYVTKMLDYLGSSAVQ